MSLFTKLFDIDNGYYNLSNLKQLKGSTKFNEVFDSNKLAFILNNKDEFMKKVLRSNPRNQPILEQYYLNSTQGKIKISYNQKKDNLFGRYYAKGSLSGQSMLREARYTIFDEYIDLDIVNCHPNIILWMCINLKIPYNYLNQYITNRESIINDLIKINPNKDKEFFKSTFLALNNGGIHNYNQIKKKNSFISGYKTEMDNIRTEICKKMKKIKEITEKLQPKEDNDETQDDKDKFDNIDGKTLSRICNFVENQILLHILEYFKKILNPDDYFQTILCFDGLMLKKNATLNIETYKNDIIKHFNEIGLTNFELKVKPMNAIDLTELGYNPKEKYSYNRASAQVRDSAQIEVIPINHFNFGEDHEFGSYYYSDFLNELKKEEFEDDLAACKFLQEKLPRVAAIVGNNIIIKNSPTIPHEICSLKNWGNIYQVNYYTISMRGKPILIHTSLSKFVFMNMKYFHIFNSSTTDFSHPRNDKEFDLSKPFKATITDDVNQEKVDFFKKFMKEVICNNDDKIFEYMYKWLAFTVKFPDQKTKCGIYLQSSQGTGKGHFMDFLCNYIYGLYNTNPNINGIEQLTGEKNHHLLGMKLIGVNEASSIRDSYCANSNKIKSIITEDQMFMRPLYANGFFAKQALEIILCTNFNNAIMMEESDRRWLVSTVSLKYRNDKEYFSNLRKILFNQEAGDSIYTDLMSQQITASEFLKLHIPTSKKKEAMQELFKSNSILHIEKLIKENPGGAYKTVDLYNRYCEWCDKNKEKPFRKTIWKSHILERGATLKKMSDWFYHLPMK